MHAGTHRADVVGKLTPKRAAVPAPMVQVVGPKADARLVHGLARPLASGDAVRSAQDVPTDGVPTKPRPRKRSHDAVRYRGVGAYYYRMTRASVPAVPPKPRADARCPNVVLGA